MSNKLFNWGIIGPGRIAHTFAKAVEVIDSARIYAIASRSKERADNFAQQYHAYVTYSDYKEVVNDPQVDAIYIATPHRFHLENTLIALDAGKPVLCEKPLAVNAKEAKTLIDSARKNNVFLMEALWTRYLPIYKVVKSWLDEGIIGDIKLLDSTFGFAFERDIKDRKFNHDLAGGTLLDLGVYNVAISQWVMNQNPKTFSANGYLGNTNVDELLAVILQYKSGALSQFSCTFLSKNENEFIIYGTKGYIKIHNMFWGSKKATLFIDDNVITEERPFRATGFEYQIEEAMKCIEEGKIESPIMSHADTFANMELMDNIRKEIGLKYNFE